MAALFCIVSAVPKVIVWIMNPITAVMPNVNDLLYIVFAVYIIDVIAEAFFKIYENEKELDLIDANIKLEEYDEND